MYTFLINIKNISSRLLILSFTTIVFGGCIHEEYNLSDDTHLVTLELFTRVSEYGEPTNTRVGSANENEIGTAPWVLVFSGSDNSAVFVEAVQAIETADSKRYVVLQRQENACQLLILANTPSDVYVDGTTSYPFNAANLNTILTGATLSTACEMLLTPRLAATESAVPYVGQAIPMSTVVPVSGINNELVLGTLYMNRAVTKLLVTNRCSDFKLLGISYAGNLPRQGRLHQLTGESLMDNSSQLGIYNDVNYIAEATPSEDGTVQGTWANPLYVYETLSTYNAFFIICGEYEGTPYYYKTLLLNDSGNTFTLYRQTLYSFNITSVTGPGFTTLADALVAPPSNALAYTITVNDSNGYEIIANTDYYMAISNSHYVIHTPGGTEKFVAFTIINNCTHSFPNDNKIEVESGTGLTVYTTQMDISGSSSTVVTNDVQISVSSAFTTGAIHVRLGNLDKTITIERRDLIPSSGAVISDFVTGGDYASAYIDDPSNVGWLKLSPFSNQVPTYYESIYVGNGEIYLHVDNNATGAIRENGVVYVGTSSNTASPKRIKYEVGQSN